MKYISFEDWFAEIIKIAESDGWSFPKNGFTTIDLSYWNDLYDEGLTPKKAWEK
jgi:hypothetical protein